MAAQLGNYVLETATSPGTGGFTLNGAEANRRAFSAAFPSGGNVFYFADDGSQAEWGIGTLTVGTPSTLARSTVLGNTAGTKVALNFPGSVEVYNEIPAEMVPVLEQDGSLTLAGGLTVKGKALVQDVDDFTSQEAVPAAQADERYFKNSGGTVTNGYFDGVGLWGGSGANGAAEAGDITWGTQFVSRITYLANAKALFCLRDDFDNYTFASVQLTDANKDWLEWQFRQDGQIYLPDGSQVATRNWANSTFLTTSGAANYLLKSDASNTYLSKADASNTYEKSGNCVTNGTYQADFATTNASVINLPYGKRILSFSVSIADGDSIDFPMAFSGVPTSIQLECMQSSSRMTKANPTALPTASGIPSVGIQIVAGDHTQAVTTPITVWVTAIGPK